MFRLGPVTLAEPLLALVALLLCFVAVVIAIRRRINLPPAARFLIILGVLALCLAAGLPAFDARDDQQLVVMVDLSPSTRTARYRDPDFLRDRIAQLLGRTPHRTIYFADEHHARVEATGRLPDLLASRTHFAPPDAAAVLLFSDAQFDAPATAPPTYVVVDPLLQSPPDASIEDLSLRDERATATVENRSSDARALTWLPTGATTDVPPGRLMLTAPPLDSSEITARLSAADAWPENDALRIHAPPSDTYERWWISTSAAPEAWLRIAPGDLAADPAAYLSPSVVALDNVPAAAISGVQQERLHQYVRDLGGALVVLGGDGAFAAGAYTGTTLDRLSPLASSPPMPTVHWVLLADASGSMAAAAGGDRSRWEVLRRSLGTLLPYLPPNDPVSIGSFAESLRWWSTGRSARETGAVPFPNVTPHGPTNLESALTTLISQFDPAMPKELFLLTDADAQITQLDAIEKELRERRIRLHLLALGADGRALEALERLARATGGESIRQLDPAKWTESVQQLFQQAAPDLLITTTIPVTFLPPLNLAPRTVSLANRTWLKSDAALLARSERDGETIPMSARWNIGAGTVLAAAFQPTSVELESLARQIERPPRDPRFTVNIEPYPELTVSIDATEGEKVLNELPLTLELTDLPPTAAGQMHAIPQTAPGRYGLSLPTPTRPSLATVRLGNQILARRALPARYAPEFESIGNNLSNMRELAARTGGAVLPPTQTTPLEFEFAARRVSLTSWAAAVAALLLAAGLIRWRLG